VQRLGEDRVRGAVADALEIAPIADGVLVVADASTTERTALTHLTSQIERVGGTVVGAILNNFDSATAKYSESYGKYYGGRDAYKLAETRDVTSANGASPNSDRTPAYSDNGQPRASRRARRREKSSDRN
jgi:Mrp family chromosome partitioning ATPase